MRRKRLATVLALALVAGVITAGGVATLHHDGASVLRTVPLAHLPTRMVVDIRTGRAFVASVDSRLASGGWSLGSCGGYIQVLDTHTGALLHTTHLGCAPWAYFPVLAVDERSNRVFVFAQAMNGYTLFVLDAGSGRLLRMATPAAYPTSPSVAVDERSGRIYVPTSDNVAGHAGHVQVLDGASGRALGAIAVPGTVMALAVDGRAGRLVTLSNLTNAGGQSLGTPLSILDVHTGHLLGSVNIGVVGSQAIGVDAATGLAFVPTYNARLSLSTGGVTVVDTRSGKVVRTVPLSSPPTALAVDEQRGHVFVVTVGPLIARTTATPSPFSSGRVTGTTIRSIGPGSVVMLDARSGRVLRTVRAGMVPGAVAVDTHRGRVFVMNAGGVEPLSMSPPPMASLTAPGSVSVLDAGSGTVRHTIPLGKSLSMMALDDRAGRVFVLDDGGSAPVPDTWGWLPAWLRRRLSFVSPLGPRRRIVPPSVTVLDASH